MFFQSENVSSYPSVLGMYAGIGRISVQPKLLIFSASARE